MGRPSKFTPERREAIIQAIRDGNYAESAARLAGVSSSTFYRWMETGSKAKRGEFREFWETIKRAEAEAEDEAVKTIRKAGRKSWVAAMTYLERRYPDRWGRRRPHEVVPETEAQNEAPGLVVEVTGEVDAGSEEPDAS